MTVATSFHVICFNGKTPKFAVTEALAPSLANQVQSYLNGLRQPSTRGGASRNHNFRLLAESELKNIPVYKNLAQEIITGKMLFS